MFFHMTSCGSYVYSVVQSIVSFCSLNAHRLGSEVHIWDSDVFSSVDCGNVNFFREVCSFT